MPWLNVWDALHSGYKDRATSLKKHIDDSVDIWKSHFDFSDDLNIEIIAIDGPSIHAMYISDKNTIQIDPMKSSSIAELFCTLAHEITHAQQYHLNQLDTIYIGLDAYYLWDDIHFDIEDNLEHAEYLNYPWEIEARNNEIIGARIYQQLLLGISYNTI